MTTPSLQSAVRRAYDVFGAYVAPNQPLNVCTFCCMDEELEREMRAVPLRKLKRQHFYEYGTGAKSVDGQSADEVKYLLPRLLELLAAGEETTTRSNWRWIASGTARPTPSAPPNGRYSMTSCWPASTPACAVNGRPRASGTTSKTHSRCW